MPPLGPYICLCSPLFTVVVVSQCFSLIPFLLVSVHFFSVTSPHSILIPFTIFCIVFYRFPFAASFIPFCYSLCYFYPFIKISKNSLILFPFVTSCVPCIFSFHRDFSDQLAFVQFHLPIRRHQTSFLSCWARGKPLPIGYRVRLSLHILILSPLCINPPHLLSSPSRPSN